jgi:hypothetical protein
MAPLFHHLSYKNAKIMPYFDRFRSTISIGMRNILAFMPLYCLNIDILSAKVGFRHQTVDASRGHAAAQKAVTSCAIGSLFMRWSGVGRDYPDFDVVCSARARRSHPAPSLTYAGTHGQFRPVIRHG